MRRVLSRMSGVFGAKHWRLLRYARLQPGGGLPAGHDVAPAPDGGCRVNACGCGCGDVCGGDRLACGLVLVGVLVLFDGVVAARAVFQAAAVAIWCLWSFSRLWVAVISRHSERTADRPRRWKLSIRRLCLV